jgi:uncharacterized membrane protein YgdD (TMEM256/DUF423 family)
MSAGTGDVSRETFLRKSGKMIPGTGVRNGMGAWLVAAGANGLIAVAMGAFAAHGLRAALDPTALGWIETASRYQLWHALALVGIALLLNQPGLTDHRRLIHATGWLFLAGVILFAGSLYLLALTGWRGVAWITPFGGLALIAGWAALVLLGVRRWRSGGES